MLTTESQDFSLSSNTFNDKITPEKASYVFIWSTFIWKIDTNKSKKKNHKKYHAKKFSLI